MKHIVTPRFDLIFITIAIFITAPILVYRWPTLSEPLVACSWIFLGCCGVILWRTRTLSPKHEKKSLFIFYLLRVVLCQIALIAIPCALLSIIFNYVPPPSNATVSPLQAAITAQQTLLTLGGLYPWSLYLAFTLIYVWRFNLNSPMKMSLQRYLEQPNIKRLIDSLPNAITIVSMIAVTALLLCLFGIQLEVWLGEQLHNPNYHKLYLGTPIIFSIVFGLIGSKYAERKLVLRLGERVGSLGLLFVCYVITFMIVVACAFKLFAMLGGPLLITLDRSKTNHFQRDTFIHATLLFCWALQLAWAPYVATLFARFSTGRKPLTVTLSLLTLPCLLTAVCLHSPHALTQVVTQVWQLMNVQQMQQFQLVVILMCIALVSLALFPVKTTKHLIQGWLPETKLPKRPLQYYRLLRIILMSSVSCMALLTLGGIFALEYLALLVAFPIVVLLTIYCLTGTRSFT